MPTVTLEELFSDFMPSVKDSLEILTDDSRYSVIIGRGKGSHEKYGLEGTLFVGLICEVDSGHFGRKILIDAINPHKIFISGKTGSGKSYTLGVIAEELADLKLGIGTVIVDPMGTFWSMKYEIKGSSEKGLLDKWGIEPKSYDNVKVFVPIQLESSYLQGTYDNVFAISPSELTAEDWANTFGLDYFRSPQSAVFMDIVSMLFEQGRRNYTIRDMIECLDNTEEIQEKYQANTVRAIKTRLEQADSWGVFSTQGTSLQELSVPDQISVIDVSLLPDNTRALVVGLLAKKILDERTRIVRQEKIRVMTDQPVEEIHVEGIPITWLMVDEAHVLVPSRGQTAASEPLIEFAKRGRMPGCALVLATQQPAATNDQILSQVDILISHNLSYTVDISELKKRTPSKLPSQIGNEGFIRNLPVGAALISDQSTTTERTFVARIRPRRSEHGGRAVSPVKREIEYEEPSQEPVITTPDTSGKITDISIVTKEPVKPQIEVEGILDLNIPTLQVDIELAQDYLIRFMEYRVNGYVIPYSMRFDVASEIFDKDENSLMHVANKLVQKGYKLDSKEYVDDNLLLKFESPDSMIYVTCCHSNNSTIIVTGYTPSEY
jgi:hypothetical protein